MTKNMFSQFAEDREKEQEKIKEEVSTKPKAEKRIDTTAKEKVTGGKNIDIPVRTKKTEEATTMTIYIKVSDKKKLKTYALKEGKSSAAVISEMINRYCN